MKKSRKTAEEIFQKTIQAVYIAKVKAGKYKVDRGDVDVWGQIDQDPTLHANVEVKLTKAEQAKLARLSKAKDEQPGSSSIKKAISVAMAEVELMDSSKTAMKSLPGLVKKVMKTLNAAT